jgi:hypothetical protein
MMIMFKGEEISRVGQSAKTPPFHGGMTGSTPVRGTKEDGNDTKVLLPFFF